MWWFTLIKYFLTTVLMKISAAKLDNTRYHRNWITAARSRGLGIGGCDNRAAHPIEQSIRSDNPSEWANLRSDFRPIPCIPIPFNA
ncbi:hypothetical protein HanPI659440_Chr17g0692831 [Helianthus annuus]|nr:hypothetical protein HanPI659440_Chr17g0692831 [Helianthus annuus]